MPPRHPAGHRGAPACAAWASASATTAPESADRSSIGGSFESSRNNAVKITSTTPAHAHGHNELLDRFCRDNGRDPRTLRRAILLGYLYVQETPWRSEEDFHLVVERWRAAGMDEIVWVYPPHAAMPEGAVEEGLFERLAREVMTAG